MRRGAIAALCTSLLLLGGCGDDGPTDKERAAAAASASAAEASESAAEAAEASASASAAAEKRRQEEQQKLADDCNAGVEGLLGSLQELDSRLSVGMNYDEYGDYVGDAQVAYDRLFKGPDLKSKCLVKVAVPLEAALNAYIRVLNLWGECINDYDCDFSEGSTNDKAQKDWASATKFITKAETALSNMAPA